MQTQARLEKRVILGFLSETFRAVFKRCNRLLQKKPGDDDRRQLSKKSPTRAAAANERTEAAQYR